MGKGTLRQVHETKGMGVFLL
jgi:hypothetical protein